MQFRRLKLTGFKSFVEPAELRIEPGLTGVVGPNGCGKSNLLEAIRWVMGESSPKSLRGGGMEDVIFAGTTTRPPRDFAEVVLSAHDGGEDLEVTRRIERGAGSAYRINGRDARQKDVALIFADAATGAHSPALVSQGRIAAVIAAKPAERRAMLEDLMAGLDAQMNSLRRQARAAEKYRALSDAIRLAEGRLIYARWREAAAAAQAARDAAQEAEAQVAAAQAQATTAQASQASAAQTLAHARDAAAQAREDSHFLATKLATLTGQLEAAEQRLSDLDRQADRLARDQGEADRLTQDAAAALEKLTADLAASKEALAREEARRPDIARRLYQAEADVRSAELALAQATAAQAGVEAEWRVAQAEVDAAQTRLSRADADIAKAQATAAALESAADPAADLARAQAQHAHAQTQTAAAREALTQAQTARAQGQAARDAAALALSSARADLAGVEREYQALIRDRDTRAKAQKNASTRPLALDHIRAAPGYERALAAVLGRDAGVPLGAADGDGRFWTGATPPARASHSLADHVPQCPPELAARLALVIVAETDDQRPLAPGQWLVTLAGHVRRWDGFVARGEGAAQAARLEADNRLIALETHITPLRDALAQAEAAATAAAAALAEAQTAPAERALAAAQEAERQALRAQDAAEAARDRLIARRAELAAQAQDLSNQRATAAADHAAARQRRDALPRPDAGRAALEIARQTHEQARRAQQSAHAQLAAQDQALTLARERVSAQGNEIRSWQLRAGDAARRLASMAAQVEDIAQERAACAAKPPPLRDGIAAAQAERDRLAAEESRAQAAQTHAQTASAQADSALAHAQETLAQARETRAGAQARAQSEEQHRAEMGRICGERFQCPPVLLTERLGFTAADVGPAPQESATLERQTAERERLGPVNLVAAEELADAEARAEQSTRERAEITEAVHRLRGSIGSLNREGRERLRAAFEAVDGHFRRLFTTLFQGGQAHLALVDSDDPLEAGLEIFAQPPGKRLQSLTLLSGGEQALTAVALIFALFLTNPSPICVLDEVDAPLDDANIERFCDLLTAMTGETQTRYLIVTHNAVTMSRMHRLFGVTMVEPGVSRLVSVDLMAAKKLVAEPA